MKYNILCSTAWTLLQGTGENMENYWPEGPLASSLAPLPEVELTHLHTQVSHFCGGFKAHLRMEARWAFPDLLPRRPWRTLSYYGRLRFKITCWSASSM